MSLLTERVTVWLLSPAGPGLIPVSETVEVAASSRRGWSAIALKEGGWLTSGVPLSAEPASSVD